MNITAEPTPGAIISLAVLIWVTTGAAIGWFFFQSGEMRGEDDGR